MVLPLTKLQSDADTGTWGAGQDNKASDKRRTQCCETTLKGVPETSVLEDSV